MLPTGYSPYQYGTRKSRPSAPFRFNLRMPGSLKKWLMVLVGIVVAVLVGVYLSLGDLKFFANHIVGFGFFKKHYLILLQNNYELRPTGGFITAYGDLTVTMGVPSSLEFRNSYEIDTQTYVTPPKPQEELLKSDQYQGYTFRDANWEPDFRNTAAEVLKFYQMKYPDRKVDGVVAVNFSLVENLLDRLGGIEIAGKELDGENVFSQLEFEVNNIDRHNIEDLRNRKSILGDLATALLAKAKRHPLVLRNVVIDGLKRKEILVWTQDESLEKRLIEKNWAGALAPAERSDFLHVNLANYGAKKADRYVQEEVHYTANATREVPEIGLEVTLRYPGLLNTYSDNYKGYLRVYLPKTADVESSPVDSDISTEGEFKVVGSKIVIPAGSKISLNYLYTLPRSTFLPEEYRLRVAKQPGSNALFDLTVQAAEGKRVVGELFKGLENRAVYLGRLAEDTDFLLNLRPDPLPPYPIEQEFDDLAHLRIVWDKPVSSVEASDPANYQIADTDKVNPTQDKVTVKSVNMPEPNITTIEIEGASAQNLEQYSVTIKGVKDQAGNLIIPNPKTITVVQRIKAKSTVDPNLHLGVVPPPATNPVKP